jgi:hypothetical protein
VCRPGGTKRDSSPRLPCQRIRWNHIWRISVARRKQRMNQDVNPVVHQRCCDVICSGLAGRWHRWRTTYVGGRIPPPAVVACQRLWPDTERPAYISRRVPPLARLTCQRLWPDTERSADLARRVPPLAARAVGRAHRRRRDRHGCHRGQHHHDDGNKMANERPHYGPPLVVCALSNRARA